MVSQIDRGYYDDGYVCKDGPSYHTFTLHSQLALPSW